MTRKLSLIVFLLLGGILTAQNFKFGKVSKEEVLEEQHPLEPDAEAAILYNYQRTYYDYHQNVGFKLVSEFHQRIKIYNKDGFDWATKEIELYQGSEDEQINGIKAVTYNIENGKLEEYKLDKDQIFEEEKNEYRKATKFTMPAVTEGSVIEIEYTIVSPFLGAIDQIPLQRTIPVNKTDIMVSIPEYLNFAVYNNPRAAFYVKIGRSNKPFRRNVQRHVRTQSSRAVNSTVRRNSIEFNQNVYTITQDNIPSLIKEKHVDHLSNYAAFLDWELKFTSFPNSTVENYSNTWEGVSKTIYLDDGYKRELNKTNFYQDELDELLSGQTSQFVKTQLIFEYVKNRVKWNGFVGYHPEKGLKDAYKERVGNTADINLLVVSMLKYAGLDANPVLVSTRDHGIPIFPTRNGFNYVIASVKVGENQVLLDATDPFAGPGELPARARNWQGRLIKDDTSSDWVSLNPASYAEDESSMNVRLGVGSMSGKHARKLSGLYAKKFRSANPNIEKLTENLSNSLAEVELSEIEVEALQIPGTQIKERYNFETKFGQEVIGDMIYFKPMFFETIAENPFKAEERSYPVYLDFPSRKHNVVNILIPEGYEVESMPDSEIVKLMENSGQFKYFISKNQNFIRLDVVVEISQAVFPAENYEFLKKFFSSIIEKQNESIVLRKIQEDELGKRTESGR